MNTNPGAASGRGSLHLQDVKIQAYGMTTQPADMHEAARLSLSESGYQELMKQTGGRAPTRAELCAAADQEHAS